MVGALGLFPVGLLLLGFALQPAGLAVQRRRGVPVGLAVQLLGVAQQLLGLGLRLVEQAHVALLIRRRTAAARPPLPRATAPTRGPGCWFRPPGTSTR